MGGPLCTLIIQRRPGPQNLEGVLVASGTYRDASSQTSLVGKSPGDLLNNMNRHEWKDDAACLNYDTNFFFEKYEEDETFRPAIEKLCSGCPVRKQCFAVGITQKEWGVWGGVYLENGKISREFNRHKTKEQWGETWKNLTTERKD